MKSNVTRDLHALIQSMTQHEKRYFKLFAEFSGKRRSNNYIDLFDALHGLKKYSGAELEKEISGKSFVKSLPSTVHHLFSLVLRSLKSYHSESCVGEEVRSLLASARVLQDRALYGAAMRLVRRARRKAEPHGSWAELVEALALERSLLFQMGAKSLYNEVEDRKEKTMESLGKLNTELEMEALRDQHLALRLRRMDSRRGDQAAAFTKLMESPLLKRDAPTWFRAAETYHSIHGNDSLIRRDHEEAYKHLKISAELWESEPVHLEESPGEYLRSLTDLMNACLYTMRWFEAEKVLGRIEKIPIQTAEQESLLINQTLYTALLLYMNSGRYAEASEVIDRIERFLSLPHVHVPVNRRLTYFYNITIFHFIQEDYRESLRWLNQILQFQAGDLKQHIRDFARLFQLVLHYELDNLDLVEYLFRSAYRHYRSRNALQNFEQLIFASIRKMVQSEESEAKTAGTLYEELWGLHRNLKGKEPAGMYEMIFWAQAKAEGRKLSEVFQGRVDERMALVEAKESGLDGEALRALEDRELR